MLIPASPAFDIPLQKAAMSKQAQAWALKSGI
jgi:hypothetical protein